MEVDPQLVRALFDDDWYRWRHPDVSGRGVDPWSHFWAAGVWEGRDPTSWFDSAWYLLRNQDVGNAGHVAFLHFISQGVHEGRSPNSTWEACSYWPADRAPSLQLLSELLLDRHPRGVDLCAGSLPLPDHPPGLQRVAGGGAIFHEVGTLVDDTGRSGIHRVGLALAETLSTIPDRPYLQVRLGYHGCQMENRLSEESMGLPVPPALEGLQSWPVPPMSGDWLLMTSLTQTPGTFRRPIDQWRDQGGYVLQVVHDLLPIHLPESFPDAQEWFREWLTVVTTRADLLVCDSEATADDLRAWLVENPPDRPDAPMVTHMRLGYDLSRSVPHPLTLRTRRRGCRRVLCVGTIEPRKGVESILEAAESLWRRGEDVEFVLVGRPGWADRELIDRLVVLHRSPRPLTWLRDASDEELRLEYLNADLLVMASRGEGFGLPIVEALAHGTPVVARDLPVFRELLGDHASFFERDHDLADVLMSRLRSGAPIEYVAERLVPWRDTAADLLGAMRRFEEGILSGVIGG
jgi:glycosyltransferase involved in cell wall biosynthesis